MGTGGGHMGAYGEIRGHHHGDIWGHHHGDRWGLWGHHHGDIWGHPHGDTWRLWGHRHGDITLGHRFAVTVLGTCTLLGPPAPPIWVLQPHLSGSSSPAHLGPPAPPIRVLQPHPSGSSSPLGCHGDGGGCPLPVSGALMDRAGRLLPGDSAGGHSLQGHLEGHSTVRTAVTSR